MSRHLNVELSNFNDDGTGHYKAIFGHDDLVMSAVQLEFVKSTLQYVMLKQEFESTPTNLQIDSEDSYNPYSVFDMPYDFMQEGMYTQNLNRLMQSR